MLTGEKPEVNAEVAARLAEYGHDDFTSYVAWACERALERGMLPHTNVGVVLARGAGAPARGDRVAGADARVGQPRPRGAPGLADQAPGARGSRRSARPASCASRSPAASSWASASRPRSASPRSRRWPRSTREHGHLQEVILQNFVPHPRYYGAEPAEIADEAQRGERDRTASALAAAARWATPITLDDMRVLVRECRRLMPDVGVQIPPNLSDWWLPLVEEGATDLGGLSANGDHISPEHPFPSVHRMRKQLKPRGYALTERLCVYPQYMDPEWLEQGVLDVIKLRFWSFIPRRGLGPPRGAADPRATWCPARSRARRDGGALVAGRADRPVRRDAPGGDRGHAPGGRRAARRAGRRDRHLRRQPQHQRLEHLHGGLRVLRLRAGQALARRLRALARPSSRAACARRSSSAPARSACSRASTPTGRSPTTRAGCAWPRTRRRRSTCTPTRRWRSTRMAADLPLAEVFERLRDAGLGSTPGTAAEVLHDGVRERISPNKLPVARWVEVIEACHAAGAALHRHGDVRPHRGALGAGRAHARGARAAGAHRRLHRVRAAVVHPVPHAARPHPRDRGDLARGEPQAHRGVPAGARAQRSRACRRAG